MITWGTNPGMGVPINSPIPEPSSVADPLERARRRQCEHAARGEHVTLEEVLRAQAARDQRDAARDLAPLR